MTTILLVDDEARMLDLLELYLLPNGFTCIKFEKGTEALRYLYEGNKADLMLLDIMMPSEDGWEICLKVRKMSDLPVIMLTARSQTLDVVKGLNIGADDYITKPFEIEELIARQDEAEGVLAGTVAAGARLAAAAFRTRDDVAFQKVLVAGKNMLPQPFRAAMEPRFLGSIQGNADFATFQNVLNVAILRGFIDRSLHQRFCSSQKSLTIF